MPLPTSWVDYLFAKLSVRYGDSFMRQWPDADPAIVKGDWAEVLDGTARDSLSYALRYLPERPLNAIQFRDICRRAPSAPVLALQAPLDPADPGRVAAIMSRLRQGTDPGLSPADKVAHNILRLAGQRGGKVSPMQRAQLEAMGWREDAGRWVKGRPLAVLDAEGVR